MIYMNNYDDLEDSAYADMLKRNLKKKDLQEEILLETSFMKKHMEDESNERVPKTIVKRKIDISEYR